jgi:hypothetical protein
MFPELALIPVRRLVVEQPCVRTPLLPGDRVVAVAGSEVAAGDLLAERIRDARLAEVEVDARLEDATPGSWLGAAPGRRGTTPAGELLFTHSGRHRIATGPHPDRLVSPGIAAVTEVTPGVEIALAFTGVGIPGAALLGEPGHGRLVVLRGNGDGRVALDVAHAGAIIVLPGRADAETLTRARAMGIAGAIVPALAERDRRDVAASEARQRAGLHRLAPFPVLVLDGYVRRGLGGPIRDLLVALEGTDVGLAASPPFVVAARAARELPLPPPDRVRVRGGAQAGEEGRFLGLVGPRRFAAGIVLEAARVALDDGRTLVVSLGDLERFA